MSKSPLSTPNRLMPPKIPSAFKGQPLPSNGQTSLPVNTDLPGSAAQGTPSFSPTRTSPNRRARSESIYPRKDKASLLAQRKRRPSLVTGGYETTSDDNKSSSPELSAASLSLEPSQQNVHSPGQGRMRAQALMSPKLDDQAPNGDVSGMSELGVDRKRNHTRRRGESAARPNSREILRLPPVATSIPPSHLNVHKPRTGNNLPTSRSDSFYPHTARTGSTRTATSRIYPQPSRSASMISDFEERADGTSSPHSRKGKGKDKESQVGGLAMSLGLNGVKTDTALSSRAHINNFLYTS
ncbi:MAG: hypothetical protein TREMPRED_005866 [Tremellales sp. Tagirdzhanova-0007]|nr:MAG: hypothetical protein TREMPRED_005866 [Tremellales sp. Tagirdzhanova-0007]